MLSGMPDNSESNGIGETLVEGQMGLLEIQNYHTYCLQTRLCNNAVLEYSQTSRLIQEVCQESSV